MPEKLAIMAGWHIEYEFARVISEDAPHTLGHEVPSGLEEPTYFPLYIDPDKCVDLNPNTHHLYIYCNLVHEIMVGDIFAKMLRDVSTRSENYGQYVTITFTAPHYLPLASSYENYVEISIRDDVGELIPFGSGKVIVTLHFRSR